jgi:hypothetical protein
LPFEPRYIEALAIVKLGNVPEYERIRSFLKGNVSLRTLDRAVKDKVTEIEKRQEARAEEEIKLDVPADVKSAAKEIISQGRAYEYIYGVWQNRVKGNQYQGKGLLVSRGVQSCLNSKGIHVYSHGRHGQGKSEGMEKMAELVPPEFMMDEDVSPLSIYYASEEGMLEPGTTLYIDEMVWIDSLGVMVKRITTKFQTGATHLTVIDGKPKKFHTKPRIAIWTNSADMHADEQARDRFLDVPIDENQTKEIMEFQKIRDTLPGSRGDEEFKTNVCQEILRDLALKAFTVKVPYARAINIPVSEGTRGLNIFLDSIKGLAALRYAKREKDDKGQLLATREDFDQAVELYEGINGHSEERYTTSEKKVLKAIIDNGRKATASDIERLTGLSDGRIRDIINGRGKDEQKKHGLRYKCPRLEAERVDISINISDDERRTTHPLEYSLPDDFELATSARGMITLDPNVVNVDANVVSNVSNINNIRSSNVINVENKGEGEYIISEEVSIPDLEANNIISHNAPKSYVNTLQSQEISKISGKKAMPTTLQYVTVPDDSEKALRYDADTIDASLNRYERTIREKEEHFRTPNNHQLITLRFLDDIAEYKKDEVAGIGEDEAHRLLNMNTPKFCELVLAEADREHFNNALKSLVREYPFGEILRRGVTIDDVAAQSNLARTEVVALLDASGWAPKNTEEEPRIWFKPIRNLFSKIGEAKRLLNAGVISDLKSSGYTEQTVDDLFNTFIGGKIGQLAHYRYGAEASTAAN